MPNADNTQLLQLLAGALANPWTARRVNDEFTGTAEPDVDLVAECAVKLALAAQEQLKRRQ